MLKVLSKPPLQLRNLRGIIHCIFFLKKQKCFCFVLTFQCSFFYMFILFRELTLAIIFIIGSMMAIYWEVIVSLEFLDFFFHLSREVDLLVIKFWIVSLFISILRKCAKEACLHHWSWWEICIIQIIFFKHRWYYIFLRLVFRFLFIFSQLKFNHVVSCWWSVWVALTSLSLCICVFWHVCRNFKWYFLWVFFHHYSH